MANKKLFQGSGGGGPTTTPDSLQSEDIVEFALAVSEGPIRGLTKGAYSFYLGETPLVSEGGGRNFEKFAIGVHPGYPEGSAKPLNLKLGGVSSNFTVGVALMKNVAVTRQTEAQLRGQIDQIEVRIQFARLLRVNDEGSTYKNTAKFKLEYRRTSSQTWQTVSGLAPEVTDLRPSKDQQYEDNGPFPSLPSEGTTEYITVKGKTSSGYSHEIKFDVPRVNDDWVIRVTKLSPDNDPEDIVDMSWESYQVTNRTNLTFPDTAIIHGIGVANGQFSSIPDLGGVYDGLVIRVPTNYNPDDRTYDESTPWNGSFKFAWTNNPAWILYDMIVNERYGLAKHRRYLDANRFSFYRAAKWCDEMVPVFGTDIKRPRYTFNMQLSEARPGLEMLNYVAGSFNGLVWDDLQGQIHLRVDKDEPAVMMFTPENVTEEGFQYSFTDLASRANDVSVAFINPDLDWNEDRRRIPGVTTNEEHIEKYGRIPMDFIAVGCTDVNEAVAKAQIRLISALTETTTVSFQTMRQGALLELYDIILVADPDMGWSQSGRLTTYDSQWLNFRDPIYIETMGQHVVRLQTVEGVVEVSVTPEKLGNVYRLKLLSALPPAIPKNTVFTIEGASSNFGYAKPFRVMSIAEVEGNGYVYSVTAVEVNRSKYAVVEGSPTDLGDFDYSTKMPYLPGQPINFNAVSGDEQVIVMPTGEVVSRILCTWQKPFNTVTRGYVLQYRLDEEGDTDWQNIQPLSTSEYISPVIAGKKYILRLASVDANGKQSSWVIKEHVAKGKSKTPPSIANLTATGEVFQIKLRWSYGTNPPPDLMKVEVWGGTTNNIAQATKLTDLAYPATEWTHLGLGVNARIYYWIRVQDSFLNYSAWTGPSNATTVKSPTAILQVLENSITTTQLVAGLNTRINLIDAPATTVGSVAQRILNESQARDAAILAERNARVTDDEAIASEVNALATRTGNNEAAILTEKNARTTAISSEATTRQEQFASFDTNIKSYVQNYSYSKATSDASINQVYSTLRAEFGGGATQAYVQNYTYSKAEANTAISTQVNTVTSRLNNIGGVTVEQAMKSNVDAITGIKAEYTVKIDVDGRVIGYGLMANSSKDSIFAIVADKFAVAYPGQTTKFPFKIGMVNGVSVIGIDGQLMIDGSLTVREANIENAAITSLKLAGEAVTIPIVSSSPEVQRAGLGEGTWTVINEAYINLEQAGLLYILVTAGQGFVKNDRFWSYQIRVNGEVKRQIMGRQANDAPSLSKSLGLPAGTHLVEVAWSGHADVRQGYCELFMMGVKR